MANEPPAPVTGSRSWPLMISTILLRRLQCFSSADEAIVDVDFHLAPERPPVDVLHLENIRCSNGMVLRDVDLPGHVIPGRSQTWLRPSESHARKFPGAARKIAAASKARERVLSAAC